MQSHDQGRPSGRLFLRLSSLGDVILASSALETAEVVETGADWVVAREYGAVLRGHPRIGTLWEFDRRVKAGLFPWLRFSRQLWHRQYAEVVDLHGSIRARVLRLLFRIWAWKEKRPMPAWKVASKQRLRSWGFILFKGLWPRRWLSRLQVEVFARTAGGKGDERPNLVHLLTEKFELPPEFAGKPYVCVMPGSNWPGKTWAAEKYYAVLRGLGVFPVVLGQKTDPESVRLVELLERNELPFFSGVGRWNLRELAHVLAASRGYIGSDTGLAHLAEAVGTRIFVIYGPTAKGLGFEPWRDGSGSAGSSLWCRPCGKIGNRCYRIKDRHACLKAFPAEPVLRALRERFPE